MTVGNFLQNKGIQDMYFNNIKKNEEEINKDQLKGTGQENKTTTNGNIPKNNDNDGNNITTRTKAPNPQTQISIDSKLTKNIENQRVQDKKEDFPTSLQYYITRAFQQCKNNEEMKNCQKELLKIMVNTIKLEDMYTKNWDIHPLPNITSNIIQDEPLNNSNLNKSKKINTQPILKNYVENNSTLYQYFGSGILEKIESYKPIIGKCTDLEKDYYRMTEHPDCSQIRPEYILKKSFIMLIDKWKNKTADYKYISMQFRSIRQDLTIQIIQNEFSVRVYETNAKIALESYDLPQFNQCQTALIPLYSMGIIGNKNEFFAYRILYTSLYEKIEMSKIMSLINKKYTKKNYSFEVSHSIQILKSLNELNYFKFLILYTNAPNMGKYLIEPFLPRLRIKALQVIAYGYYSEINISFICTKLCFKTVEDCVTFIQSNNLFIKDNKMLCKENISALNSNHLLSTLICKN